MKGGKFSTSYPAPRDLCGLYSKPILYSSTLYSSKLHKYETQNQALTMAENKASTGEIQVWGRKCFAGFNKTKIRLEKAGDHPHLSLIDLEIEHARFKIWAGNLGVLLSGASSLDARLRDSRVIRSSMLRLMGRLSENIEQSKSLWKLFWVKLPY